MHTHIQTTHEFEFTSLFIIEKDLSIGAHDLTTGQSVRITGFTKEDIETAIFGYLCTQKIDKRIDEWCKEMHAKAIDSLKHLEGNQSN
jgi:hypothetical protein